MTDVDYTFYESPKFLSPKAVLGNVNIDESTTERIEPTNDLLNKVVGKFNSKKQSFRSVFVNSKPSVLKRRRSKKLPSPKRKKSIKSFGRKKRRRSRRSKRLSQKRKFGLKIMSGMGGLGYSN